MLVVLLCLLHLSTSRQTECHAVITEQQPEQVSATMILELHDMYQYCTP